MTSKTTAFLQRIQDDAETSETMALPLADQQGLVLLPQGLTMARQIELLQQCILDLGAAPPPDLQLPEPRPEITDLDCQVTVEERAQLFNFLHP